MFTSALAVLTIVLDLAIAFILVRKYLGTRDIGFIWLGLAVVIWPVVSRLMDISGRRMIDGLLHGKVTGFFPFSLVERGQITVGDLVASMSLLQQLVGVCLVLVAVLYLSRAKNTNFQSAI